MELPKAEESKRLDEGKYSATLTDIIRSDSKGFDYVNFIFNIEGVGISKSCPANITLDKNGSPTSGLAKTLKAMGVIVVVGEVPNTDSIKGKTFDVMIVNKTNPKGTFSNIVSVNGQAI